MLLFVAAAWPVFSSANPDGEAIFNAKCHTCHKLPSPDKPPKGGWDAKLQKMAMFAHLKKNEKQSVLEFLKAHEQSATLTVAPADDRRLLEKKCSRCHTIDRIFAERPDAAAWEHIVSRMKSFEPGWIDDDDAKRIVSYLTKFEPKRRESIAGDDPELFANRCSACHTLERIFTKLSKSDAPVDWSHLISRMQQKAPGWLSKKDAEAIYSYLQSLDNKRPDG